MRRSQGIAGEWQILTPLQPPVGTKEEETDETAESSTGEVGVKREADAPPDEEDTRAFKLRKKTLNRGLGEIYDPGLIPIKIKKKEEVIPPIVEPTSTTTSSSAALKWTPTQWKRPGDNSRQQKEDSGSKTTQEIKLEESSTSTTKDSSPSKWAKPQWTQPLPDLKQEEMKRIFGNQEQLEGEKADDKFHNSDIKTEPDVKEESQATSLSEALPSNGLFKKRKAPSGAGRGRREI